MVIYPSISKDTLTNTKYSKKIVEAWKKQKDDANFRYRTTRLVNKEVIPLIKEVIEENYQRPQLKKELKQWIMPTFSASQLVQKKSKIYINKITRLIGNQNPNEGENVDGMIYSSFTKNNKLNNVLYEKDLAKHSVKTAVVCLKPDLERGEPKWETIDQKWYILYNSEGKDDKFTEICIYLGKVGVGLNNAKKELWFIQNTIETVVIDADGNLYPTYLEETFGASFVGNKNPYEMQNFIAFKPVGSKGLKPYYDGNLEYVNVIECLTHTELNYQAHYGTFPKTYSTNAKAVAAPLGPNIVTPLEPITPAGAVTISQLPNPNNIRDRLTLLAEGLKAQMVADGFKPKDVGIEGEDKKVLSGFALAIEDAADNDFYDKEIADAMEEEEFVKDFIIDIQPVFARITEMKEKRLFSNNETDPIPFSVEFDITRIVVDEKEKIDIIVQKDKEAPIPFRKRYMSIRPELSEEEVVQVFEEFGVSPEDEKAINLARGAVMKKGPILEDQDDDKELDENDEEIKDVDETKGSGPNKPEDKEKDGDE